MMTGMNFTLRPDSGSGVPADTALMQRALASGEPQSLP